MCVLLVGLSWNIYIYEHMLCAPCWVEVAIWIICVCSSMGRGGY